MNKKFIYSLVLTSIFLMSTLAVCLQPAAAANWKFGVPKEAIGMKLQSEVKVYDKDLWGDCIGLDSDDRAGLAMGSYREGFSSDGDNVGARSQSEITDWESQDFWFMGDSLLYTWMDESVRLNKALDRTGDGKSDLLNYWDGVWFAEKTLAGLANRTDTVGTLFNKPLIKMVDSIVAYLNGLGVVKAMNRTLMGLVQTGAFDSTYSREEVTALFHKTYETKVVERDVWYWDKDADFGSDPDETDAQTPFIVNPEELFDSWVYFYTMVEALLAQVEKVINDYTTVMGSVGLSSQYQAAGVPAYIAYHVDGDLTDWDYINSTIYGKLQQLSALGGDYLKLWQGLNAPLGIGYGKDAWYAIYDQVTKALQEQLIDFFRSKIPDRAEYLLILLKAGIPAHQDVAKWLEKMVDEFSIDKDKYYNAADNPFKLDVSVDGLVVTADIEWATGVKIDDSKPWSEDENQREDYTIVFTYSDTGGQSSKEYNRDGDVFYRSESIAPTIPGYEVSILLGAGAIATLGLIFVVIKKRRM